MTARRRGPCYQNIDGFRMADIFLPEVFRSAMNYKPRDGDLFVVSFPKSGTTWTQQIVNLIFNKGVSVSSTTEFLKASPFLECAGFEAVDRMGGQGPIKTHFPYHMAPHSSKAKYLYVVRNPKDTLVSFFHHTCSNFYKYENGDFDEYFEIFLKGENDYEDYFDHVLGWYEHRNDPNVMFMTYEELKRDKPESVMKIAAFMGDNYNKMLEDEPDVFSNVLKYSSLQHMKFLNDGWASFSNIDLRQPEIQLLPLGTRHLLKYCVENPPSEGKCFTLVREGIVGGWRQYLTEDQNNRFDKKIDERLRGTELYDFWKRIDCM